MEKYILLFILFFSFHQIYCQTKFNHILITNDDGMEDADRLLALAKSVKDVANRVSIIVSTFDRFDEIFDYSRSFAKGAVVLHMLRGNRRGRSLYGSGCW